MERDGRQLRVKEATKAYPVTKYDCQPPQARHFGMLGADGGVHLCIPLLDTGALSYVTTIVS